MSEQKPDKFGRRTLIKSAGLLALTTSLAGCGSSDRTADVGDVDETMESLSYSRNELRTVVNTYLDLAENRNTAQDALQSIGSYYLNKFDQSPTIGDPSDEINQSLEKIDLEASDSEIQRQIVMTMNKDFKEDRLAVVEGWWLSGMEVHLSSVIFLLSRTD